MRFLRSRSRDVQALAARRLAALADGLGQRSAGDDAAETAAPGAADQVDHGLTVPRAGRHVARAGVANSWLPRLSSQHLTIIAIVVAAACVFAGWQVVRSAPKSAPVELSSSRLDTSPPEAATQAAGVPTDSPPTVGTPADSASAELLVIDVAGRVRRPGIVELPRGSRVVDALRAAGGARPAADTSTLNLARLLVDGEQIVVGIPNPGGGQGVAPDSSVDPQVGTPTPINLNTATPEQLDTLPGVGPVTAAAILEWRTQNGSFSSVDELLEVSGIGEATLRELEPYVHV